jgi:hypothetical protein
MTGKVLRHAPGVLEQALDDEVLLLAADGHDVVHLDPVAASLWAELRTGAPLERVTAALAETWAVEPQRLVADLSPVVDALLAAELLVEQDEGGPRP